MRVLAGLGSLFFLYLALIPAGLVGSTLDSACAGELCETSGLGKAGLTLLYGLTASALIATGGSMAAFAMRGTQTWSERIIAGLQLSTAAIGLTLFVLFTLTMPVGGLVVAVTGVMLYAVLAGRRPGSGDADDQDDAGSPTHRRTRKPPTVADIPGLVGPSARRD